MSDIFINLCSKMLDEIFKAKNKPHMSILLYILSGIMVGLCGATLIVPFRFSVNFLDGIVWLANISNQSIVVQLTFKMSLAYVLCCLVRKILVRVYQEAPTKKIKKLYTFLYTVDDIVDFVAAICSVLFAVSIFLQVYKTGILFISAKAIAIYIWITVRAAAVAVRGFAYRNSKIIEGVIKNYPDLM